MTEPVEVRVTRRFAHPRERVFEAFVDPDRAGEWLFRTEGGVMERTDYDPTPGGEFAIFERRGGDLARHFGRFVTVEPPRLVAFDFWVDANPPVRVTVGFQPDGDGCLVTLSHDLSAAWVEYRERSEHGWSAILAALDRTMETAP